MARPKKPRRCCCPFSDLKDRVFKPRAIPLEGLETIEVAHDEMEALKLCYLDGLNQEEAAREMGISRGTVQRLLVRGRKKILDALVNCKAIVFVE
ncbi:MAG: DUF134 domain-containing protein [Nitrospirae bacterium]|nr:MAG: DUF134 domain-containing protein [Nitrospirota bacterium]